MALQTSSAFPLRNVTKAELESLCQILWNWPRCEGCDISQATRRSCRAKNCSWRQRSERLELFFHFYREVTSSYVPDFFGDEDQALRSHQDLFDIISMLKTTNTMFNRDEYREAYFTSRTFKEEETTIPLADQERAFNLAATVMTMVKTNCADDEDISITADLEQGRTSKEPPFIWHPEQTLQTALIDAFPTRIHPSLQELDAQSKAILSDLTATNLTRISKLKFLSTNDLRHHLKLDPITGTVQIFHHTTFLKEHLLSSKRELEPQPTDNSTPSAFTFPRPLALETLYTLQLLFPYQDPKSQSLLRNLVSKQSFDPDILRFGTTAYELGTDEKNQASRYPIWGTRLMDLYDEIENPKPRGVLDAWLERRSKSRHVMMATIVGVSVAIVLGILSLGVSCFQAWISWREWKDKA